MKAKILTWLKAEVFQFLALLGVAILLLFAVIVLLVIYGTNPILPIVWVFLGAAVVLSFLGIVFGIYKSNAQIKLEEKEKRER
jgi:hypothetical protein